MLYHFIRIIARVAIRFYCRKIVINKPACLSEKGPLLLACNHPNSFLDSVIIDTLFNQPVWSLARGDVFKKPFYIRLLTALKILPVYRTSEGVENLSENYRTFNECISLFRKQAVISIFSEGKCINEWHLRPLKKGTARLAMKAWEENIPLKVLPVGLNYSSYHRFGKNMFINFGNIITKAEFDMQLPDGARYQAFNSLLQQQLEKLVMEIPKSDKEKQRALLEIKPPALKQVLLFLPAILGWLTHAPLFIPVKSFVWKRTAHNDHYDSVMVAILLVAYPLYLLFLTGILFLFFKSAWIFLLLLLIPFTAWAFVQLKPQLDREGSKVKGD